MIQNSLFPPQRMCVQLDDSLIAQFLSYWVIHGKPCKLSIVPSEKVPSLVGVCFTVRNDDYRTMEFMKTACAKTGARLWNLTEKKEKEG